jgi:hypothetical protein
MASNQDSYAEEKSPRQLTRRLIETLCKLSDGR